MTINKQKLKYIAYKEIHSTHSDIHSHIVLILLVKKCFIKKEVIIEHFSNQ